MPPASSRRSALTTASITSASFSAAVPITIQVICLAFLEPGDEVIYTQYGFLMFPAATRIANGVPVVAPDDHLTVSVDAILERVTPRTKIVFLANPNNPTGTMIPDTEVRRLRAGLPDTVLLVLDSAYAEYVDRPDYTAGIDLVEETDNTRHAAHLLEDVRYGRSASRLGVLPQGHRRHDVLGQPAVQHQLPLARGWCGGG